MKLGLGLYRHMLTPENFQFARQAGATHVVVHLVDYFKAGAHNPSDNQPTGTEQGWGLAGDPDQLWTVDELVALTPRDQRRRPRARSDRKLRSRPLARRAARRPEEARAPGKLKTIIRRVGEAGIPIFGYNFSIAGVCGRVTGPFARGGATSVGMDGPLDTPMPRGMAWNMVVDPARPAGHRFPRPRSEQLWQRLDEFLDAVLPVAEEAGVTLAAHPDDPPLPTMRGQPRLVYQPQLYQRLLDLRPSPANALEFCIGTLAEMADGDVYEATDQYSRQGKLAYVHFRNVTGKVPHYRETFVDDGDVDMLRILRILKQNNYDGVIIPDHTPQMTCAAPWHAGMAYALGYMQAALKMIQQS